MYNQLGLQLADWFLNGFLFGFEALSKKSLYFVKGSYFLSDCEYLPLELLGRLLILLLFIFYNNLLLLFRLLGNYVTLNSVEFRIHFGHFFSKTVVRFTIGNLVQQVFCFRVHETSQQMISCFLVSASGSRFGNVGQSKSQLLVIIFDIIFNAVYFLCEGAVVII